MQKRIFKTIKNSDKKDKRGRVKGYFGSICVWPNRENEFFVKVKATRDNESFGPSQGQVKFTDFETAKSYMEKTVDERLAKLKEG